MEKHERRFDHFSCLPVELRLRIWSFLCVNQPLELIASSSWRDSGPRPLPRARSPLLYACRESRSQYLRGISRGFCITCKSWPRREDQWEEGAIPRSPTEIVSINHDLYWDSGGLVVVSDSKEQDVIQHKWLSASEHDRGWSIMLDHRMKYLVVSEPLFQNLRRTAGIFMPGLRIFFVLLGDDERQSWTRRTILQGSNTRRIPSVNREIAPALDKLERAWLSYKSSLGKAFTANPFKLGEATPARLRVMFIENLDEAEQVVNAIAGKPIKHKALRISVREANSGRRRDEGQ